MATAAHMKMVNGRVDDRSVGRAAKVLERRGLTVSAFIRNSIEHVARTGEVPECGMPVLREGVDRAEFRSLVKALEAKPMPGRGDFAGIGEDELVGRVRLERYAR